MIEGLIHFDLMQRALIAGVLASLACGIVGTYVVARRMVFITGGISHSCYAGIGLGYFIGFDPMLGATGAGLVSAIIIGLVNKSLKQQADVVIGVIWAVGMAAGIVLVAITPGYAPDLMSYLFGNILFVPPSDIVMMLLLDIVIVVTVVLFFKEFQAISFDEEFAAVGNLPVLKLYLSLLALVGLTVVLLIRVVGIILVIALLTIPPAISRQFVHGLRTMMILSVVLGMGLTTGGLLISYRLGDLGANVPSGAVIILLAGASYLLATGCKMLWTSLRSS